MALPYSLLCTLCESQANNSHQISNEIKEDMMIYIVCLDA